MNARLALLSGIVALAALPVSAEVYRQVDAQGNVTYTDEPSEVEFRVTSSPGLRGSHKYEVTLDGQPVGQSASGTVMVRNVFRGTHDAGVNIVDSNGVTVKSGETITFTIHRPSVNN